MPVARFEMPDGRVARFEVPEGTTPEQAQQMISASLNKPQKSIYEKQAEAGTGFDNFMPAVGGAVKGVILGGKQRIMQGLDAISPREGLSRVAEMAPDVQEHREAMKGLGTTKMGMAGDFAGNVLMAVPTMLNPAAATLKGAAAVGSGFGFLQPTMGNESALENAAIGGAAGAAGQWVGNKIGKALVGNRGTTATGGSATATNTPGSASASSTVSGGATAKGTGGGFTFGSVGDDASAGLTKAQQQLLARNPDFKLTPGQASGSRSLQQMEAKLESQPMTSGTFNAIKDGNQKLINRRVAESIGVKNADIVDGAVLDKAHERVSRVYDIVKRTKDRAIEPEKFINGIGRIDNEYQGLLFANGKPYSVMDNPLVSRLYSYAEKGTATAEQLTDLSSKLGKAARSQMTSGNGDRQLGMALNEVKDMADDLIEQGLNGRTQKLFSAARGNYRNLMTLEGRIGIVNPSNGNVSGANLANALQQKDKAGFLLGRNQSPMYDAARLAQAFKPVVGDSGTATRSALPGPTDFLLSLPFNVATRAYTSAPVVNLAAQGGNISRNGLLQTLDPATVRNLPKMGTAAGLGLLSLSQ